jgi:hypothetical protein
MLFLLFWGTRDQNRHGEGAERACIEGVAIRDDPESCAGVREGGGEVLTGARAGWAIEPRKSKQRFGVPTLSKCAEGNIVGGVVREPSVDPAWSKTLCMHGISMRENREIPRSLVVVMAGRAARGRLRP